MAKQQISKSDYMLLFIRINSFYDQLNQRKNQFERVFKFEHVLNRFAPNDHIYSTDKDTVTHCYRELEVGQYYMVFAHRVEELNDVKKNGKVFSRWIWRAALNLDEKQIRKVYSFYLKHSDEPKLVGEYADFIKNPRILPMIDEFDYEGAQNE